MNLNETINRMRTLMDLNESVEFISSVGLNEGEEKKADRCLKIARRKYDKPSAYRSGAIVKCRQGKIWKDLKEEEDEDLMGGTDAEVYTIAKKLEEIQAKDRFDILGVYRTAGLLSHGGSIKIKKFDPNKIVGGARGDLGFGYYFSQGTKAYDYGKVMTFLDSRNFNLIDGEESPSNQLLDKLKTFYKKNIVSETGWGSSILRIVNDLLNFFEKNPKSTVRNAVISVISSFPRASQESEAAQAISIILREIGYDGIQVANNWQVVLFPNPKLDDLIVDDPNIFAAEQYVKSKESNPELAEAIENLIGKKNPQSLDEDESLHKWFSRKGEPGGGSGWVDCNTCRKVDGKTKCKACGREKGEKRSKYPSCRPTPSGCKDKGKGKKWGKTK